MLRVATTTHKAAKMAPNTSGADGADVLKQRTGDDRSHDPGHAARRRGDTEYPALHVDRRGVRDQGADGRKRQPREHPEDREREQHDRDVEGRPPAAPADRGADQPPEHDLRLPVPGDRAADEQPLADRRGDAGEREQHAHRASP